jgi:hypothetical protein
MLFKKASGFLCFFLCLQWMAAGQSFVAPYSAHYDDYSFGINRHGSDLLRSANPVVKQLALQLTRSTENTHYSIDYSYRLLSAIKEKETWKLGVNINIDKISGDVTANGFDISKLLIPQLVSFDLRLIGDDGRAIDSSSIANITPGKDTVIVFSHSGNLNNNKIPRDIELSRIVFGYDKSGLDNSVRLFKAIKKYEAALMLADYAGKQADLLNHQAINPRPEMLIQIFELSEAVRLLAGLHKQWNVLERNAASDLLLSRQKILAYRVHYIQQLFIKNAATSAVRQSRLNIVKLSDSWVSWQVKRLTDQQLPEFARLVFYQLGNVSCRSDDLAFLQKAISLLLKSTRPDALPVGCFWAMSDAVTKAYLKEGEELSSSGHYTEAADLLQSAGRNCEAIPFATCSDRIYQQQSAALYGTYHSLLSISRKALAGKRVALADRYVDAAAKFQAVHSRFIITDLEVKELCAEIAEAGKSGGHSKSGSNIADLAKTHRLDEDIAPKILNVTSVSNPGDSESDITQLQTALNEIQRLLEEVSSALALGNCEQSFDLLDNIKQLMLEYGLPEEDPFIMQAGKYWNRTDSLACEKNQEKCRRLKDNIGLFSGKHEYINAFKEGVIASEIIRENPSCNINSEPFEELLNLYRWPAAFQQKAVRVDSLLYAGNAVSALELYLEAGELFVQYKLSEQGLVYLPLAEFSGTRHNCDFYTCSINFLLDHDRIEESLTLLNRMEADKFTPEQCKIPQEKVAEKIAKRDSSENKPIQVHQRLLAYTGGSEWYSHFRKAYLKTIHM